MTIPLEFLIGIGVGLILAVVLFGSQHVFGQLLRLSPCGCFVNVLVGLCLIAMGLGLLVAGGYVSF
jgi:hypothetical protein